MRKVAIHLALLVAFVAASLNAAEPRGRQHTKQWQIPGVVNARDYATIQDAIDAASFEGWDESGVVWLGPGVYETKTPLNVRKRPVCLWGLGGAVIRYTGPPAHDEYLLTYQPKGNPPWARCYITDVSFDCRGKIRGMLAYGCRYNKQFANIAIHGSVGVGIDAIDCWGSHWSGLEFRGCRGIAFRGHRLNSVVMERWKIDGDCTQEKFFPDPTEKLVADHRGRWVQTLVAERASVVLYGSLGRFQSMCFETPNNGSYPGIYINAGGMRLSDLLFEGGDYTNAKIRLASGVGNVVIESIEICDRPNVSECVVECMGPVKNCRFQNISGYSVKAGIIFHGDGNQLRDNVVSQVMVCERGRGPIVAPVVFREN